MALDGMICLIAVVIIFICVMIVVGSIWHAVQWRRFQEARRQRLINLALATDAAGLPRDIKDALPVYTLPDTAVFSSKLEQDMLCSICLVEYEKNEELVLLPCRHSFHHLCVETWFQKHTTCPLCRGSLLPGAPTSESNGREIHDDGTISSDALQPFASNVGSSSTEPEMECRIDVHA